jgi:hypothetical protein
MVLLMIDKIKPITIYTPVYGRYCRVQITVIGDFDGKKYRKIFSSFNCCSSEKEKYRQLLLSE